MDITKPMYKVLAAGGLPCNGGTGVWSLATQDAQTGEWIPGEWMPPVENVKACHAGYHLCDDENVMAWVRAAGPNFTDIEVWLAEGRGDVDVTNDKAAFAQSRTMRRVMSSREWRLLAADYAEHVLPNFEAKYPNDTRVRDCIATVRRYANGQATDEELRAAYSAADSAACSAACRAAYSAAYSAADRAADRAACRAADSAADSAAYSAAYSAADRAAYRAACRAADSAADRAADRAAYSAEQAWQLGRLRDYLEGRAG